ncbi:hypothetical protein GCM10027059_39540 [Myceligenerans halotolerans]
MFGFTDYSEYRRNEQEITRRNEQKRHEREIRDARRTKDARDTGRRAGRPAAEPRATRARWA